MATTPFFRAPHVQAHRVGAHQTLLRRRTSRRNGKRWITRSANAINARLINGMGIDIGLMGPTPLTRIAPRSPISQSLLA
jgi:hypothetical protein